MVEHASKPTAAPGSAHVDPLATHQALPPCTWWQIDAPGQRSTRVCWVAQYGLPTQTWSLAPDGWQLSFFIESIFTKPIPSSTFAADLAGFQVRDVDQLESED